MKLNKRNFKSNKAITLIALVITIIVLLILAGVTIATLTGDNGLLQKATTAKQANEEASALEKIQVEVAGSYGLDGKIDIENQLNDNLKRINGLTYNGDTLNDTNKITKLPAIVRVSGFSYTIQEDGNVVKEKTVEDYPEIAVNVLATENSRYVSNNKMAIIPKGYTISSETTEQSIDTGLVIKKDGSEWVWIPVNSTDLAAMYTEDENGWTMSGTSGEDAVVTKYKTTGTQTRENPGNTSNYREPDMLNNADYDKNETNWTAAGFTSYVDMATKLKNDYKNMIASIKKNGGFYVGRYELGGTTSVPQVKAGAVLNKTSWYDLYKACKTFGDESNTYSRMIWGCQWDQVCKFISTAKDADGNVITLSDSKKYGNYEHSLSPANTNNGTSNFNNTTGRNAAWKTNNIFDLAGNCREWTQEAYQTQYRASRGGYCGDSGDGISVTYRYCYDNPTGTYTYCSSRPVLYAE